MKITVSRDHDFCAGHRVYGHEGKCARFHGHGYRATFTIEADTLDVLGRIIDYSVIKDTLVAWVEREWDHRMLLWVKDPAANWVDEGWAESVVLLPFNPTAENMAAYLLAVVAPNVLPATVRIASVVVQETPKCSARAEVA